MLTYSLITLTFIDLDHQILPDNITIPLIWLGLFLNSYQIFTTLSNALSGAIIGYLSLWIFIKLFYIFTKKEGMGEGDFKLFSAFGAWFGAKCLLFIILLSSFLGSIIGIIILNLKGKNEPIPFGPFLALAAFIYFLYGDSIIYLYLHSVRI